MAERKSVLVPVLVAVVAVVTMVLMGLPSGGTEDAPSTGSGAGGSAAEGNRADDPAWAALVRREPGDPMAMGEVDAPVVMVSYSEFQCPFCGKFARDTEPQLVEKYVRNGTLRIEWRDFPYLGPESTTAAHAARAAAAQGRFWDFHDALYADQPSPNSGTLDEEYLVGVARDLGLDPDRFVADMRSEATRDAVQADFAQGQAIGVTGTPAFLVNGVPIIGAQPTRVFVDAVEQAAEAARG